MVFFQILLLNPSLLQGGVLVKQPIVIQLPLYGKYKTRIMSVQYNNANSINTIIRLESRQLMSQFPGSDALGLNFSSRYINIIVGSHNNNQPQLASFPMEFITTWDGVFEIMVIDLDTNAPIVDNGNNFSLILNMDVEPVDSASNVENNTITQHLFQSMPVRTFTK
jgi:hypothetical protein